MKKTSKLTPFLALIASSTLINAELPLFCPGDSFEYYLIGAMTGKYESNIFLDSIHKKEDFYTILSPGAELFFGDECNPFAGHIFAREDFYFYAREHDLNRQEGNIFLDGSYSGRSFNLFALGSFNQTQLGSSDIRLPHQLVKRNLTSAKLAFEWFYNDHILSIADFYFDYTNFRTKGFGLINRFEYRIPVAIYYKFLDCLGTGAAYFYRHTERVLLTGINDHFIGASLHTPTDCCFYGISFDINFGVIFRKIEEDSCKTTLGFNAIGRWTPYFFDDITLSIATHRDFRTGAFGSSIIDTGISADAFYSYCDGFGLFAGVELDRSKYETDGPRTDDTTTGKIGVIVSPMECLALEGGYEFINNDSTLSSANFIDHTFYVRGVFRY